MDMVFRHDACRIRNSHAPSNFTTIRHSGIDPPWWTVRCPGLLHFYGDGRGHPPHRGIIDTSTVTCIAVRGPHGDEAGKTIVGRKRVVPVDAGGTWLAIAVLPAAVQERDTCPALDQGSTEWPGCLNSREDGDEARRPTAGQ